MIPATDRAPTRILKRRSLAPAPGPAQPHAPAGPGAAPEPERAPPCVPKQARLVRAADGASAVEVRCSCGEVTRVELQFGPEGPAKEQR
jgi:hypothetical protein